MAVSAGGAHAQSAAAITDPVENVTGVTVDGVVAVHVKTCPSVVYTAARM